MASFRLPGPVCKFLGAYGIDLGTLCRAASPVPGSVGVEPFVLKSATAESEDQIAQRQLLLETVNSVVAMLDVQPRFPDANGNTDTTWCNRAANTILTNMGYDTSALLNRSSGKPDIGYTNANSMAANAKTAANDPSSGVKEVSEKEARALAQKGVPVLALAANNNAQLHGHAGIVVPDDSDKTMIGQAGLYNGIFPVGDAFGILLPNVHYYVMAGVPEDKNVGGGR
jgi:hypothetical protein